MEQIKGWKTVTFFALALVLALANLFGFADFKMSPEQVKWFEVLVPFAGLFLRAVTDSGIFKAK